MAYLTWADILAAGVTAAQLQQYAPGDTAEAHPRTTKAIASASGEMDEYLKRRGIAVPLDTPLPAPFDEHLISLVLDFLTLRLDRRPQSIADNAEAARNFFERVATGKQSVEDTDPATEGGSATDIISSAQVRMHSVFDTTDADSDISRMLPPIGGRGHTW